ncbi:hypothetical protein GCM10027161_07420 [Microbispora hainanensis]
MSGVSDDGMDSPSTARAAASSGSKGGGVAAEGRVLLNGAPISWRSPATNWSVLTIVENTGATIQRHAAETTPVRRVPRQGLSGVSGF